MKTVLATLAAVICFATSALALPYYTPSQTELNSYQLLSASDLPSTTFSIWKFTDHIKIRTDLDAAGFPTDGPAFAEIGTKHTTALDLGGYDTFSMKVANVNENPWNFYLFLIDSDGTRVSTPSLSLNPLVSAPNNSAILTIDLLAISDPDFDLHNVQYSGLGVAGIVPLGPGQDDYTPEITIAPVPEPGTMMLLGAGFLCLAIYGKRRRNA